MLDVLEAGVGALRSNRGNVSPEGAGMVSAEELRAGMAESLLSASEVANALSVPCEKVDDWLSGRAAIPSWAPVTIRVIARLAPPARRRSQNGTATQTKTDQVKTDQAKTETKRQHPFSRIEEL